MKIAETVGIMYSMIASIERKLYNQYEVATHYESDLEDVDKRKLDRIHDNISRILEIKDAISRLMNIRWEDTND